MVAAASCTMVNSPAELVVTPFTLCEVWVLPPEEEVAVADPPPVEELLTKLPEPPVAVAEVLPALLAAPGSLVSLQHIAPHKCPVVQCLAESMAQRAEICLPDLLTMLASLLLLALPCAQV